MNSIFNLTYQAIINFVHCMLRRFKLHKQIYILTQFVTQMNERFFSKDA